MRKTDCKRRWIPAFAGMTTGVLAALSVATAVFPAMTLAQEADPIAGKAVFDHWCKPCHAVEPRKHPGTAALQVLYKGEKPAALEQRLDLTPDLVSFYVRNGVSIMPFFRKTEISDEQLVDLGAYLGPSLSPDRQ